MPRLEHFVRLSNLGPRRVFPPIKVSFPAPRQALVSETAFMLWCDWPPQADDRHRVERAVQSAQRRLGTVLAGGDVYESASQKVGAGLTDVELSTASQLANRIATYVSADHYRLTELQVEPSLPGCGVITGGTPDLLARYADRPGNPSVVVEVKTVDRTFRSNDFRQLATYVVLVFAAHRVMTEVIALFNPLRGTSLEVGTEEFFDDVAGAPADEVAQRLMDDWSSPGTSG